MLDDYVYINISSYSLTENTFDEPITRAEVIYSLVRLYYEDEYESVADDAATYSDVKNGGTYDAGISSREQYRTAIMQYMLDKGDNKLDDELYRAMVVAYNHGLLGDTDVSEWGSAVTKEEALQLLVNVYEDLGTTVNFQFGQNSTSNDPTYASTDKTTYILSDGTPLTGNFPSLVEQVVAEYIKAAPEMTYAEYEEEIEYMIDRGMLNETLYGMLRESITITDSDLERVPLLATLDQEQLNYLLIASQLKDMEETIEEVYEMTYDELRGTVGWPQILHGINGEDWDG